MNRPVTIEDVQSWIRWCDGGGEYPPVKTFRELAAFAVAQHTEIERLKALKNTADDLAGNLFVRIVEANNRLDKYERQSESGECLADALTMREEIERMRPVIEAALKERNHCFALTTSDAYLSLHEVVKKYEEAEQFIGIKP